MKKTLIIAEAGVNHNGDIRTAIKLVDTAKSCGADVIKFQTYTSNKIAIPKAPKAKYQIINGLKKENMYQMLKKYELSFKDFEFLKKILQKKKD